MDTNERDTHFQGFAKLLWDDLREAASSRQLDSFEMFRKFEQDAKQLIAQRAYDLALYFISEYENVTIETAVELGLIDNIPDLTEWPKSSS